MVKNTLHALTVNGIQSFHCVLVSFFFFNFFILVFVIFNFFKKKTEGGCPQQINPLNGNIQPNLNQAMSTLFCDPGFELTGNQLTFCNGYKWDRTIGSCSPTNKTISSSCDFETISLCDWTHDSTNDYTWIRKNGASGKIIKTGPTHDHTIGIPLEGLCNTF